MPPDTPGEGTGPELTIVMPFYNPGAGLAGNVAEVLAVLEGLGLEFEVLAVNDGSTDGSAATIEPLIGKRLRRIDIEHAGKGEAVRVGLSQGRGRFRGFIDADGDIPAEDLVPLIGAVRSGDFDVAVGSKRHPGSDVVNSTLRRAYSWGFQLMVLVLFRLRVRDTQTGIKVFRHQVLDQVLPLTVEQRYAFDLELLVLAVWHGFDRVAELPVRIRRRAGTTVTVGAVGGIMADILAIWWRLRVRRHKPVPA